MKRVRRFANPTLLSAYKNRIASGKPYFNNIKSKYEDYEDVMTPKASDLISAKTAKELKDFYAPYEFEKKLFMESDEPKYRKDHVDQIIQRPIGLFLNFVFVFVFRVLFFFRKFTIILLTILKLNNKNRTIWIRTQGFIKSRVRRRHKTI